MNPGHKKCSHPDSDCGYVLWHDRAGTRTKMGEIQTRCSKCGLWEWPRRWTKKHEAKRLRAWDLSAKRATVRIKGLPVFGVLP